MTGAVGSGRLRAAIPWLLALGVVAVLQLAANSVSIKPYDEGLILYGAARVAAGDIPYRDFWSMYGPGSFYALAGLDVLFGPSVLVGRCFDAVVRAAIVLLVFELCRHRSGRLLAASAAVVAFALLAGVREYLFVALPATACALAAIAALNRAAGQERSSRAADSAAWSLPGAAAGATLLFRHDFGFYVAVACLCALPWAAPRFGTLRASRLRRLATFVAGFMVVVGPAALALLWAVPVADLYDDLLRIPFQVYVANRELPFPSVAGAWNAANETLSLKPLLKLFVYFPIVVTALGFVLLAWRLAHKETRHPRESAARPFFVALLVLDALLCLKGAVRVEVLHFVPAIVVSIVVVANGLALALPKRIARTTVGGLVAGAVGLAVLLVASERVATRWLDPDAAQATMLAFAIDRQCLGGPSRLGCFVVDEGRAGVLAYLRRHAQPGDMIFVGTGRHDRLFENNVELYFLSGLPAATKWYDLHPGVQTGRDLQAVMVSEMTRRPPAFVVRNTEWDAFDEPNQSSHSSGVTLLDEFLAEHYVVDFTAATFSVWVPRLMGGPR